MTLIPLQKDYQHQKSDYYQGKALRDQRYWFGSISNIISKSSLCGGSEIFHPAYIELTSGDITSNDSTSQIL